MGSQELLSLPGRLETPMRSQGGRACWADFCAANPTAEEGIEAWGILDPDLANNPLAGINTVYLPYCDGGLHASDADRDIDADGINDRFHRGLHNLSAAGRPFIYTA